MGKVLLWVGFVGVWVFFIMGFLAGATSGPDMKPLLLAVYGTNQAIWALSALVSLAIFTVGLITLIVAKLIKNRKQL